MKEGDTIACGFWDGPYTILSITDKLANILDNDTGTVLFDQEIGSYRIISVEIKKEDIEPEELIRVRGTDYKNTVCKLLDISGIYYNFDNLDDRDYQINVCRYELEKAKSIIEEYYKHN